jgi:hypothetical protein
MSCVTPTTTIKTPCVNPCKHPFVYLFELAKSAVSHPNNRAAITDVIDRFLDKGIVTTNCNICCPDCDGVYALAGVETMLKLYEALGFFASTAVAALPPVGAVNPLGVRPNNGEACCSNVHASVETWLKYADDLGLTISAAVPALPFSSNLGTSTASGGTNPEIVTCCNGFTECVDDVLCWAMANTALGAEVIDRILDKGIVEYSGIYNNCSSVQQSEVCLLLQLLVEHEEYGFSGSRAEVIDRILDKGIVISCSDEGEIVMASVETWLTYGEAVGLTETAAVAALGQTTTTTTVI